MFLEGYQIQKRIICEMSQSNTKSSNSYGKFTFRPFESNSEKNIIIDGCNSPEEIEQEEKLDHITHIMYKQDRPSVLGIFLYI